jgi:hypothetical protein
MVLLALSSCPRAELKTDNVIGSDFAVALNSSLLIHTGKLAVAGVHHILHLKARTHNLYTLGITDE